MQAEFPGTKIFVRSYDRGHTLQLLAKGVDFELRETSSPQSLSAARRWKRLGVDADRASDSRRIMRKRDRDRLEVQQAEGITAGANLWLVEPVPEPLRLPPRKARPLNPEAEDIIRETKIPS